MPVVQTNKITLAANVASLIMAADGSRSGAEIQNSLASPVWISPTNPPTTASPSWCVPAAIGGVPSVSLLETASYPQQDWYGICASAGDITVRWW